MVFLSEELRRVVAGGNTRISVKGMGKVGKAIEYRERRYEKLKQRTEGRYPGELKGGTQEKLRKKK